VKPVPRRWRSRDNMASRQVPRTRIAVDLIADTEEKLCHMFGVVELRVRLKKVQHERSTFLMKACLSPSGVIKSPPADDVLKAEGAQSADRPAGASAPRGTKPLG
jgi:peroxiredoxin